MRHGASVPMILPSNKGEDFMATAEMLFLGLVLFAFAAFSGIVMWVLHDDVRNRAARTAYGTNANDETASKAHAA